MTRPGWSLPEMIVALTVTGLVVALAGGAGFGQLRFFRGVGEVAALRGQLTQAATIAANVLRDVGVGDLHVAADSAVEASVVIGTAIACAADTGAVLIAAPSPVGNTLSAFAEAPEAGDAARAFVADSAGGGWVRMRIASVAPAAVCDAFPGFAGGHLLAMVEPFVIPEGAPVRILRRTRLSHYRASDGQWYLGLKEWNGALQRFNTVQPVAGPLRPYSADPARTGLLFEYRDRSGGTLAPPVDAAQIASITIIVRGVSIRPVRVAGMASEAAPLASDTVAVSVALRR